MVAVRNLFSTLNSLAQSGLLASGWLRTSADEAAAAPADASVGDSSTELWYYAQGGVEPPLEELLHDPIIHLVMRADRLEPDQVRHLLTSTRGQAGS
jgi:hypothetical protein